LFQKHLKYTHTHSPGIQKAKSKEVIMMQAILNFFTGALNTVAWMYILLPCVAIGGLYFTVRNRAIQFTKLGHVFKSTVGKLFKKQETAAGSISPFQALTTALAATVGTGNIIGTCQAIAMGGYGAIFWLWISALLGMIIKYSEVVLAVHYRKRNEDGEWVGGPMYYIVNGLGKGWKWLAALFIAIALMSFAYSTILGWSLYGTRCIEYLFGVKVKKIYQLIFILMIIVGATTSLDVVWDVADSFNGLMAIPNFVALFALSGVVARLTREYFGSKTGLKK